MKKNIKQAINFIFTLIAVPLFLLYRFSMLLRGRDGAFQGMSQALSIVPGMFGDFLRRAFYRMALLHCSEEMLVCFGTIFSHQQTEIGSGVYIGCSCNIGTVKLEDDVTIGSGVHILSGKKQHFFDDIKTPVQDQGGLFEKVTIGRNSWIGNGSVIMANVGKYCIIGAGAVVTKDIRDRSIAVGNPAKIIKTRDE